jgi:hypothetical protein
VGIFLPTSSVDNFVEIVGEMRASPLRTREFVTLIKNAAAGKGNKISTVLLSLPGIDSGAAFF